MAKVYRTAMGKQLDVDHLRLTNDKVIAVGNMRVNAGGDELGPGGAIVKTRNQIMKEYYALNTPIARDEPISGPDPDAAPQPSVVPVTPVMQQMKVTQPVSMPPLAPIELVVHEPIVISEDSGMDEDEPEIVKPVAEILPPMPLFVPKEISVGIPVAVAPPVSPPIVKPVADSLPPTTPSQLPPPTNSIRGSLANAVASKPAKVVQTAKLTPKKAAGIIRF